MPRCNRKRSSMSFAAISIVALMSAPPAWATTFDVNSVVDAADDVPGDGICATAAAECTLRAAIQEANALAGADQINLFGLSTSLDLTGAGEDAAATGDLDVLDDVTISSLDTAPAIISGPASDFDRVFDVHSGTVTIEHVSIFGGCGVPCETDGGAIRNAADLTLRHVVASNWDGVFGGCIYNSGTLALEHTLLSDCRATTSGGGIANDTTGVLTARESAIGTGFSGNSSSGGFGGAGLINLGDATLLNTEVSNNFAQSASMGGGGILNLAMGGPGTLTLKNVTVRGNVAGTGAGILNAVGGSPSVFFQNTIIGDNTADSSIAPDCGGDPLTSGGHNLVENDADCTITGDATGNIIGVDPGFDPGFAAEPCAVLAVGSPAIDAGHPATPGSGGSACESVDERGLARVPWGDPRCDIGSCERTACGATPLESFQCKHAPKSSVLLKDNPVDSKDILKWKWQKGDETTVGELSTPDVSGDYAFCVYGGSPAALLLAMDVPAAGTCAGKPCWKSTGGGTGWLYKDKELTPTGAAKVILKSGPAGKPIMSLKGQGTNLVFAPPPWPTTVVAQLHGPSACWETPFAAPTHNLPGKFKGKNP